LAKVLQRVSAAEHRVALEKMRGFNWVGYIAAAIRQAGYRDQREVQEKTHDLVAKLLTGTLFRGFDERIAGPMDLRFRRSVGNAVRNMVERDRNRRRLLPSVPIGQELPGRQASGGERVIEDFRRLVGSRLGQLGLAVFNARLGGQETKGLVGRPDLGQPDKNVIKRVVRQIKSLAMDYAQSLGDPAFAHDVQRAMEREESTVAKRLASMTARRGQG